MIDAVTDTLVRAARQTDAAPLTQLRCQVRGVQDLSGLAAVLAAFGTAPGVSEIAVRAIEADTLSLELKARGSVAELQRALAAASLRTAGAAADGALEFQYLGAH